MYLEKPIEELMKLIEESGYSTYASWKIQHEMEEAKRLYDYLIEVQGWSYVKKKYKLNTTNFLFLCNC